MRLRSGGAQLQTAFAAAAAAVVIAALPAMQAMAEPVLDRSLSNVKVSAHDGCTLLKVGFNFRIRYVGHSPQSTGQDLRILVRALDPGQAASEAITRRESLRPPQIKSVSIKAIEYDVDPAGGPALLVQFGAPAMFEVAQGADFESIVIAVSGKTRGPACKPVFPEADGGGWAAKIERKQASGAMDASPRMGPPPREKSRPASGGGTEDARATGAALDEARAALKKGKPETAAKILLKALSRPENRYSAEAQELMGLARQRLGDLAEAQAEYEDYLQRYPAGDGAERVRQRLAGVTTAKAEAPEKLNATGAEPQRRGRFTKARDGSESWSLSGSASQFYIRDDSFHTLRDPSLPPDFSTDADDHRVHQNELLSGLDVVGTWRSDDWMWKLRFSGTEEHDFSDEEGEIVSVAALYVEAATRDLDGDVRVGRQTRNTGGVLGRFDGALVNWQAVPWLGFSVVGGSPVLRRSDEPFKDDKYFYGASVDLRPFGNAFDLTLFGIEQRDRDYLDRQAIGFETRYLSPWLAAFTTVDYDVHFQDFNAAIANATWTLEDRSTINAGVEYRHSPYLSTWTALQGQPFLTLYDLLKARSVEDVEQLAADRTATYKAATAGYARPLTEHLQWSADVTVAETSGTIASGGVGATLSTGTEIYYGTQIVATDAWSAGDMYIAGIRFVDRDESDLYVLDLNSRYPVSEALRVGPRLRLGYQVGRRDDAVEYSVLPSVLLNYYMTRDMSFEFEVGAKWTDTERARVTEEDTELFLTIGYRYDFYAEGQTLPPSAK